MEITSFKWQDVMSRNSNGPTAQDPFYERMLDERIATLRAFLRMTSEKYDVPVKGNPFKDAPAKDEETPASTGNVVPLRRAQ